MSAHKKTKNKQHNIPLSPEKYVKTRARLLPIYKCLVNEHWQEGKMANITIMRNHINGNITAGFYLVDLMAYGLKDTLYKFNELESDIMEVYDNYQGEEGFIEISYALAHNIIYGAIEFAEDFGFKPHPDFKVTQYLLEEDTDDIEYIEVTFGVDGQPAFIEEDDEDDNDWTDDSYLWDDEDWKEFIFSKPDLSEVEKYSISDAYFEKWLEEKFPDSIDADQLVDRNDYLLTVEPMLAHFKSDNEIAQATHYFEKFSEANPEDIPELEQLLQKLIDVNPDNPVYANYRAGLAELKKDRIAYRSITENTVVNFPNYIFAKINLAQIHLQDKNLAALDELFKNNFSLQKHCPDRKEFHVIEFLSFYACILRICLLKQDFPKVIELAELIDDVIDEFEIEQGNPQLVVVLEAIMEFMNHKLKILDTYIQEVLSKRN